MVMFFFNFVVRYATAYWLEMAGLEETHPWVHGQLMEKGSWTVQRSDSRAFSSIAADQAIEQTLNRDSKTSGGLIGPTLSVGMFEEICG